ncbi:Tau-tubulin kinase 1 [Trichinella nativa]|uniref:Kinase domain protein n=1 Tax=Trichinella nativa TaxID=6335 RepID=A0A0V1LLE0_9BILA|nr:Tau-tubulin kinase 1 [Trichinella nativa]OUC44699.1 kinase domain protein [Trichinella nativa]
MENVFQIGDVVNRCWKVDHVIGMGAYGRVHLVRGMRKKMKGAMKVEKNQQEGNLMREQTLLNLLSKKKHALRLYDQGTVNNSAFIVMQLTGPNLSILRHQMPNHRFSIKTVCFIGIQVVEALEDLHETGYVHRDVKPSNCAMGSTEDCSKTLYLFDFGLAKKFVTKLKDKTESQAAFVGTRQYCSPNVHRGKMYGRHDDLWSMVYMLAELYSGKLPWRGISCKNEILKKKESQEFRILLSNMSIHMLEMVNILTLMTFENKPNYKWFINQLKSILNDNGIDANEVSFDWQTSTNDLRRVI